MSLERFDPRIRTWFEQRFGAPTEVQRLAWGPIADGRHILLTAPTGSGKTLTAFLWALQQLATGVWEDGTTRVLYISPLKALNAETAEILTHVNTRLVELHALPGHE